MSASRSMFESARGDRPSATRRELIWESVEKEVALGIAAAVSTDAPSTPSVISRAGTAAKANGASLAPAASVFGWPHLVIALLLGGGSGGIAAAIMMKSAAAVTRVESQAATFQRPSVPAPVVVTVPVVNAPPSSSNSTASPARATVVLRPRTSLDDSLTREAGLVMKIRDALQHQNASAALSLLQQLKSTLPKRELEPEELLLEARAERMQGHFDRAAALEIERSLKFGR